MRRGRSGQAAPRPTAVTDSRSAVQRAGLAARLYSVETDPADVIGSPWPGRSDRGAAEPARQVTELFQTHQLELVRLAVLMVGDLATAEDVVQDAFEQLHRRWSALRKPSSALDYARSAVLNGCRSVHRRRLVARRHEPQIAASAWRDTDTAAPSRSAPSSLTPSGRCPGDSARCSPCATTWT